jgi:hypothetical protein
MSQNLTPLTDSEWDEKCDLEAHPCFGIALTESQSARLDALAKRAKIPKPPPPGTLHPAVRIPKMTEMLASDPGVPGAPVV